MKRPPGAYDTEKQKPPEGKTGPLEAPNRNPSGGMLSSLSPEAQGQAESQREDQIVKELKEG